MVGGSTSSGICGGTPPLYDAVLGVEAQKLPPQIMVLHRFLRRAQFKGRAQVVRGASVPSRIVAAIMRFPPAADHCPVEVVITRDEAGREAWTRSFAGHTFSSRQFAGRGRWSKLIVEQFGPMVFAMAVIADDGRLKLVLRGWSAFGILMPLWLGPDMDAVEHVVADRFNFDVAIRLPLIGPVVHYQGWLEPAEID